MPRLKVLFADDQIPDDDIPDSDIISVMTKRYPHERYPHVDLDDIEHFLSMREAVKVLRDGGYDVSTANTKRKALLIGGGTLIWMSLMKIRKILVG